MSEPTIVPIVNPRSRKFEKSTQNDMIVKFRHGKTELIFYQAISLSDVEKLIEKVLHDAP